MTHSNTNPSQKPGQSQPNKNVPPKKPGEPGYNPKTDGYVDDTNPDGGKAHQHTK